MGVDGWRRRPVALVASKKYGFRASERANARNCRNFIFLVDDSFEEDMGRSSETHSFESPRVRLLETVANFFRANIAIAEAFENFIFVFDALPRVQAFLALLALSVAFWWLLAPSGASWRGLARFGGRSAKKMTVLGKSFSGVWRPRPG